MKISIGGMVGVGKSTVSKMLAERLEYNLIEEYSTQSPEKEQFETLLDWQYKKTPFGSMTFQFYTLMQSANRQRQTKEDYVMDRDLHEHLIFASRSLDGTPEAQMYELMWNIYMQNIAQPDLYVVLIMSRETMLERLFNRSRKEEMSGETIKYLVELHETYTNELLSILRMTGTKYIVVYTDKKSPREVVDHIVEKMFSIL